MACQEAAGNQALHAVHEMGHELVAVLTDARREPSRVTNVALTAASLGGDVLPATAVRDDAFASWLGDRSVDLLLNVHSLYVATDGVLAAPAVGSFNLHPGPLPAYPGLNAPSWAIFEGAPRFGCTLHWMTDLVDGGAIAYDASFPVTAHDTGLSLTTRCVREGIGLLRVLLEAAARGSQGIPRRAQVGTRRERGPGPPHGGRVDWRLSAERIAAFVRACDFGPFPSPWGRPLAVVGDTGVELVRAVPDGRAESDAGPGTVVAVDGDALLVATGAGVLRLTRVLSNGVPIRASNWRLPTPEVVR